MKVVSQAISVNESGVSAILVIEIGVSSISVNEIGVSAEWTVILVAPRKASDLATFKDHCAGECLYDSRTLWELQDV